MERWYCTMLLPDFTELIEDGAKCGVCMSSVSTTSSGRKALPICHSLKSIKRQQWEKQNVSAYVIHLKGVVVLLVVIGLTCGLGLVGESLATLGTLASALFR